MPEPDFLDDGYPGCHPVKWGRGLRMAARCLEWLEAAARRAIAQPAKSAVATAALGVIVGIGIRAAIGIHSGPSHAAGSTQNSAAQPVSASRQAPITQPANDGRTSEINRSTLKKSASAQPDHE